MILVISEDFDFVLTHETTNLIFKDMKKRVGQKEKREKGKSHKEGLKEYYTDYKKNLKKLLEKPKKLLSSEKTLEKYKD